MTLPAAYALAMDAQFRELSNFTTPPRAGRITAIEVSGQVRVETDDPDGGDVLAWPLNGFSFEVNDVVYVAFGLNNPESALVIGSKGGGNITLAAGTVRARNSSGLSLTDSTGRLGVRVEHGGNVAVGSTATPANLAVVSDAEATFETEGIGVIFSRWVNNSNRPIFAMRKYRGSRSSPAAVQNNDQLGDFGFQGYDGSNIQQGAMLQALVDGSVSAGSVPTRISLITGTALGNRFERLTIKASGAVGVGTTAPAARLHVNQNTLGDEVFRLSSEATNDDPTEQFLHGRGATTNATTTTVVTILIAASQTYLIEARCVARRTGGSGGSADDGLVGKVEAGYKTVAGTVTLIGTISNAVSGPGAWSFDLVISGSNVLAQVTGAANNNITWHVYVVIRRVSS